MKSFNQVMWQSARYTIGLLALSLAIASLGVSLSNHSRFASDKEYADKSKAIISDAKLYINDLNHLYDEGDYKAIKDMVYEHKIYTAMQYWMHYDWYRCCENSDSVYSLLQAIENGESLTYRDYDLAHVLEILFEEKKAELTLDEAEQESLKQIRTDAYHVMELLGYDDVASKELYLKVKNESGSVSTTQLRSILGEK